MQEMMQYHSTRAGDQGLLWLRERLCKAARKSIPPRPPHGAMA
jgi:hypothetical protein